MALPVTMTNDDQPTTEGSEPSRSIRGSASWLVKHLKSKTTMVEVENQGQGSQLPESRSAIAVTTTTKQMTKSEMKTEELKDEGKGSGNDPSKDAAKPKKKTLSR